MLKDEKCAKIVWHSIQHLSRRPLSSEATRAGKRYATMMASPAVKATGNGLAKRSKRSNGWDHLHKPSHHHPAVALVKYVS